MKRILLKFIIAIEIIFIYYFLTMKCRCYVEHFQIKEKDKKKEPKLEHLESLLAPLFAENTEYTGILKNIMTKQTRRRVLNELSLAKGKKSYTINKEQIYLCLKDENNNYYDDNMLCYVLLHEVAHSLCDEIGHTDKFHLIFEALLHKATEMEIYNPNIPIIQNYCQYSKDD